MEKQSQSRYIPIKDYWSKAEVIKQKYNLNFDIEHYLLSKEKCDKIVDKNHYYERGAWGFYPHALKGTKAKDIGFTTEQTLFLNLLKTPTGIDFDFIKEQVKERDDNFFKIPTMDKQTFFHSAIAYDNSSDILPILNEIKEKCNKEKNKTLSEFIDFERKDENYGVKKNILQLALVKTYIYRPRKYEQDDPEREETIDYCKKKKQKLIKKN